jgi:iron complex transport system ATP-binding protein
MLELRNVSYRYPERDRDAVAGVSLSVPRGTVLSILGPNGSGKSTLLLLSLGWLKPREGEVLVDDRPLRDYSHGERARKTAFLSQMERLSFTYESREYVLLGRAPHLLPLSEPDALDEKRADEALASLGLMDFGRRHVTSLSGGELQLVRIARCLTQEAPLIMMDEPTAALDPANSTRVAEALRSLARDGRTVVFSTHDAALAGYVSDRTALMKDGRLLAYGLSRDILIPDLLTRAFSLPFGVSKVPSPFCT